MFRESFEKVLSVLYGKRTVVVGAGRYGLELVTSLIDKGISIEYIFDNKDELNGLYAYGIQVVRPFYVDGKDFFYIVAVDNDFNRYCLIKQLTELGISNESIVCYYPHRCLDYHAELSPDDYKKAVETVFEDEFGYPMPWDNPQTYNEKINWEKFNLSDERRTVLSDKLRVREWVSSKIGKEHLTRHLAIWEQVDDVDFDILPGSFVLKANNASSRNILVKNKSELDREKTRDRLRHWMSSNYMFENFEMHYKDIKPCIIAEEYLDGMAESLYDYNVFCFHGEPEYIWCIKGSHRPGCSATFYDKDWKMQPFSYGYPLDIYPAPRPEKLDEMLELTRELCRGFDHVRVDWYIMPDGRILFGEMTFQTWGGIRRIVPAKYDLLLGSLI